MAGTYRHQGSGSATLRHAQVGDLVGDFRPIFDTRMSALVRPYVALVRNAPAAATLSLDSDGFAGLRAVGGALLGRLRVRRLSLSKSTWSSIPAHLSFHPCDELRTLRSHNHRRATCMVISQLETSDLSQSLDEERQPRLVGVVAW